MNKIFNDWPCQNRRVSVGASNHTEHPIRKKKVAHVANPHATATPVENEDAQAEAGNSCREGAAQEEQRPDSRRTKKGRRT